MSAYGLLDAMASAPVPPGNSGVTTAAAGVHSCTWATEKDWTKHRAKIGELYGSRTLKEVMEFMESEHAFKATSVGYSNTRIVSLMFDRIKMYKRRIKQWGLDKNNKDGEMRAITCKTKERLDQGKRSKIRVRGKAVDDEEVVRYWRRKGISTDDVIDHRTASVLPGAVEIVTPVPSRVATPTSLAVPERIFTLIRDYFDGSFTSGVWFYDDPEYNCRSRKTQRDSVLDLKALAQHVETACRLFSNQLYQEAGMVLISATSNLKNVLSAEHPETFGCILRVVTTVRWHGMDEIGMAMLRQFCALGDIVLGNEHPLRLISGLLASADTFQFDEIIARCLRSVTDQFESFPGHMHLSTLNSSLEYIMYTERSGDESQKLLQNLLRQCELQIGVLATRTQYVRYALTAHYLISRLYVQALRVAQDIVAHAGNVQSSDKVEPYYTRGLYYIAHSQYVLGQTRLAEANLRKAIALRVSGWGARDSVARFWLVTLEQRLKEMGQWSSAREVAERRMAMIDPTDMI